MKENSFGCVRTGFCCKEEKKLVSLPLSQQSVSALLLDKGGEICLFPHTIVAGTNHIAGIQEIIASISRDERFSLVHDRHNLYDCWAVAVFDADMQRVGFLSCACNEPTARLLDAGKTLYAHLNELQLLDNRIRIDVGVYLYD